MDILIISLLVIAAVALIFFAVRFREIIPQMDNLQTDLQKSQLESYKLRGELSATREENQKLQCELQKTRTSLDSCTTALNEQ